MENKLAERSDTHTVSTTVPRMVNKLERTVKIEKKGESSPNPNDNKEHKP